MKINVRLTVDLDLDAYATEYGLAIGPALAQALEDLREAEYYLSQPKWSGLATVAETAAYLDLNL